MSALLSRWPAASRGSPWRRVISPLAATDLVRPVYERFPASASGIGGIVVEGPRRASSKSSSSSRWKARQGRDLYAREAKVQGLKSRAAFKLLEMDAKYKLFKPGQTVVDLGYAPGSWSQVAVERTKPTGRVVGVDVIPAQPPRGVSTIQGNFLSRRVRDMLVELLVSTKSPAVSVPPPSHQRGEDGQQQGDDVVFEKPSYVDMERTLLQNSHEASPALRSGDDALPDEDAGKGLRIVDVVLSDMSEPWAQTAGFWKNSLSNPYYRMMNASGIAFKDHASSMDLCNAALAFASDTMRPGGHFVCKFYQGSEDKLLERKLKMMFAKVHREKPEASRTESREMYFVALGRNGKVTLEEVEASLQKPSNMAGTDGVRGSTGTS